MSIEVFIVDLRNMTTIGQPDIFGILRTYTAGPRERIEYALQNRLPLWHRSCLIHHFKDMQTTPHIL